MNRMKLLTLSTITTVMILGSSLVIAAQPASDNSDEVVSNGTSTEQLGIQDAPRRGGGGAGGGTLKK